jgi:hypothetical protein
LETNELKTVLFIDPQKHFPMGVKMFNADYYVPHVPSDKIPSIQPLPANQKTEEKFKVNVLSETQIKQEYDLVVIVWPVNSLGTWLDARLDCMTPTTLSYKTDIEDRRELFDSIYKTITKVRPKKIVIFDGSDSPGVSKGLQWLDSRGYRVDAVFKREYRRTFLYDYDKRVHPFPFLGGSGHHPWFLLENRVKGNKGVNGCFWSGAPIYRFQVERPDEWCNRRDFLTEVQKFLVIKSGLPLEEFLDQFNTYKFFLHLNGTGHLCGRFFEGLSRDSLMIMQEMDVIFPFEKGDNFHPACVVLEPRQFLESLILLANNDKLYDEAKNVQEKLIEKYFNYSWIREYVFKTLQ